MNPTEISHIRQMISPVAGICIYIWGKVYILKGNLSAIYKWDYIVRCGDQ